MAENYGSILNHIRQFEQVVHVFSKSTSQPIEYDSGLAHRGFRYLNPGAKEFCLLKSVRAVSGLNAAIILAQHGFNQEVCTLIRTFVECTTLIDYVLAGYENGNLKPDQQNYVSAYFEDFKRNTPDDFRGSKIRQEDIHKEIDRSFTELGILGNGTPAKTLFSNIYRNFSNYIHARYPEVMDMFGGNPKRFHLSGMKNTSKDRESFLIICSFTDTLSLTLGLMIQKFDMHEEIKKIPELAHWIPTYNIENL